MFRKGPVAAEPEARYGEHMTTMRPGARSGAVAVALSFLLLTSFAVTADQIEMQNGDRYFGRLLTFTNDTLVLQSDLLGTVRLPRAKVASVVIGSSVTNLARVPAQTNQQYLAASPSIKPGTSISGVVRQPGATNIMQQVQQQFLSAASPEANQKFNEMAGGLLSGKLNVADIRAEAAAAADQLRKLKHDSGDDAGALDGYLTILDNFLRETAPTAGSLTNSAAPLRKTKDAPAKEDD